MESKRAKFLGIAILFVAFLIASFNSLSITGFNILDTDASTYIIVTMFMLFMFIIFSVKSDIKLKYDKRNIIYSVIILIFYILLLSFTRVQLSSAFLSYRIDALLFPLVLLMLIVLLFGLDGAKKLWPLMIYSLFASPLILMPIINLNGAFANLNAIVVFDFLKVVGINVSRLGITISKSNLSNISISTTCVSIGTFIAFVMFLIPVAYFYEGRLIKKFYWIVCGVLLVLFLNLFRMIFIAGIWVSYGVNNALSIFHAFAGQFIFYAAIIIMMLISYKYGLYVRSAKETKKTSSAPNINPITIIATLLVFAVVVFAFNFGYSSDVHVSPLFASSGNTNLGSISTYLYHSLGMSKNVVTKSETTTSWYAFLLTNSTNSSESLYALVNVSHSPLPNLRLPGFKPLGSSYSFLLKNGITVTAQSVISDNKTYTINYFSIPYNESSNLVMINYLIFNSSTIQSSCNSLWHSSTTLNNQIETAIYNIIKSQNYNYNSNKLICQSYLVAESG
jgi:exosortase/archaeosortase family protein